MENKKEKCVREVELKKKESEGVAAGYPAYETFSDHGKNLIVLLLGHYK